MKKRILLTLIFFCFFLSFNTVAISGELCGQTGKKISEYIPERWYFTKYGAFVDILTLNRLANSVYVGDACRNHDLCYARSNANKNDCDRAFLRDMLSACNSSLPVVGNGVTACIAKATSYFEAVQLRGDEAFNQAQGAQTTEETNNIAVVDTEAGIEMVFVKGGCYQMGHIDDAHEVCVDDFYIGKYEVTQAQWQSIMGSNPPYRNNCGDNCPVVRVSWNDVQDFINRLNQRSRGGKYRLPTEAEWEYAARSGGKKEEWSGTSSESELGEYAWYDRNSGSKIHPVGKKRANGLGIYDMSGNAEEWVEDWYGKLYYKNSPRDNPKGPSSGNCNCDREGRVIRGGNFISNSIFLRTEERYWGTPDNRFTGYGFRLLRTK